MIGMTSKRKIAVSLPADLVDAVNDAVRGGRAPNVSAYVSDALSDKVLRDDLTAMLDDMLARTGGPLSAAERRQADRILRGSGRRARGR